MPVTFIQSGRFGSGFDPLDLTWTRRYDFADATSVTTATGISQINDLSGNAGHALQGTGANQPAYSLAAQNGLNVGTFDGSNDYLQTAADVTLARPAMLFLVARYAGAAGTTNADAFSVGTSGYMIRKAATSDLWQMANTTTVSSAVVADNDWHLFTVVFNNASSYMRIDGVEVVTGTTGTAAASSEALQMGAAPAAARPFNGQIGTAALGSPQSDTDRDAMEAHLMSRWAIA